MFRATADEPGIAPLENNYLVEDIKRAKNGRHSGSLLHFGQEYKDLPSQPQMESARLAVDRAPTWFWAITPLPAGNREI